MHMITKTLALSLLALPAAAPQRLEVLPPDDPSMPIEGVGPVTVVFESGLGDTGQVWKSVQASIADRCARTVSYTCHGYDGAGSSPASPRDADHIVTELRTRLKNAGLHPPYVLVGHSMGGLYVQYFARRYPSEVQGLLLVDSMHWNQIDRVQASTPGVYRLINVVTMLRGGITRREFSGIPATAAELDALPQAERVPTIVLSSTKPALGETPAFRALHADLQNEIAAAYAARRHVFVPGSAHYIQREQPRAVIRAARELAGCETSS